MKRFFWSLLLLVLLLPVQSPCAKQVKDVAEGEVLHHSISIHIQSDGTVTRRIRKEMKLNSLWAISRFGDPRIEYLRGVESAKIITAEVFNAADERIEVPKYAINDSTPSLGAEVPLVFPVAEKIISMPGLEPGARWVLEYEIRDDRPWREGYSEWFQFGEQIPVGQVDVEIRVPGRERFEVGLLDGVVPFEPAKKLLERADTVYRFQVKNIPALVADKRHARRPALVLSTRGSWKDFLSPMQKRMEAQVNLDKASFVAPSACEKGPEQACFVAVKTQLLESAAIHQHEITNGYVQVRELELAWKSRQMNALEAGMFLAATLQRLGFKTHLTVLSPRLSEGTWKGMKRDRGGVEHPLPASYGAMLGVVVEVTTPVGRQWVHFPRGQVTGSLYHTARKVAVVMAAMGRSSVQIAGRWTGRVRDAVDIAVTLTPKKGTNWSVEARLRVSGPENPYPSWDGVVTKKKAKAWASRMLWITAKWKQYSVVQATPDTLELSLQGLWKTPRPELAAIRLDRRLAGAVRSLEQKRPMTSTVPLERTVRWTILAETKVALPVAEMVLENSAGTLRFQVVQKPEATQFTTHLNISDGGLRAGGKPLAELFNGIGRLLTAPILLDSQTSKGK